MKPTTRSETAGLVQRSDQTAHPDNIEPRVTGHSIGRWENDVLIVHTVGVRAGPLTRSLFS
jgi:hypothetical protein